MKLHLHMYMNRRLHRFTFQPRKVYCVQVNSIKYLGMWLDPLLNFTLHVDYAEATAKRAAARICNLFDGREGILVSLGVQLYKWAKWATNSTSDVEVEGCDETTNADTSATVNIPTGFESSFAASQTKRSCSLFEQLESLHYLA